MRTGMIVLAGGIGRRIGRPVPKQFLLLGGKPLLIHVLEKARAIAEIEQVVIACPADHLDATRELVTNHRMGPKFECVVGGASRQASALKGLQALGDVDSVIIHEAVRPLVSVADFRRLMDGDDRTLGDRVEVEVGDDGCHLDDHIGVGLEARHLEIYPDQIVAARHME